MLLYRLFSKVLVCLYRIVGTKESDAAMFDIQKSLTKVCFSLKLVAVAVSKYDSVAMEA